MIKQSINLLKNNTVLIGFFAAFEIITFLILFMLYPKDLSQFIDPNRFDFIAYMLFLMKMFIAFILMYALSIVFISGGGHMISEAVSTGKTSSNSFLPGLKKFFVRILLISLLLIAFSIVLSIVVSIITIPFAILQVMNGAETANITSILIMLFTMLIIIAAAPFAILWLPSIFIDNTKVFQGLKNGAKAGVKYYWKILLTLLAIYMPIIVYEIICFDTISRGIIFTPGYIVVLILEAIISLIVLPMYFIIYKEYRAQQINTI